MHFQFLFEAMSQPMKDYSMCRHHHLSLERKKKKIKLQQKKNLLFPEPLIFSSLELEFKSFPLNQNQLLVISTAVRYLQ